jgi:hypothetical protein
MYFAIIVHFCFKKNNKERLEYIIIVGIFFAVLFISWGTIDPFNYGQEWPFIFTAMIFMAIVALTGIKMLIPNWLVVVLLAAFLISMMSQMFFAYLIAIPSFLMLATGFIYSAFKLLHDKATGKT